MEDNKEIINYDKLDSEKKNNPSNKSEQSNDKFENNFWSDFDLSPKLNDLLIVHKFHKPNLLQSEILKFLRSNTSGIGLMESNSGNKKMLSYIIPILERVNSKSKLLNLFAYGNSQILIHYPEALIIVPTRDLVIQIYKFFEAFINISKKNDFNEIKLFMVTNENDDQLKIGGNIMITTPTILKHIIEVKSKIGLFEHPSMVNIDLQNVKIVVFDEADAIFEIGLNKNSCSFIIDRIPKQTPILFFSFAITAELSTFMESFDNLRVTRKQLKDNISNIKLIKQLVLQIENNDDAKIKALVEIYDKVDITSNSIIFMNTLRYSDKLMAEFDKKKINSHILQAETNFNEKIKILDDFIDGKYKVLITNHLILRGLDYQNIEFVINAELPLKLDTNGHLIVDFYSYSYRIGFYEKGSVLNIIIHEKEKEYIKEIESYLGIEMEYIKDIEYLNY